MYYYRTMYNYINICIHMKHTTPFLPMNPTKSFLQMKARTTVENSTNKSNDDMTERLAHAEYLFCDTTLNLNLFILGLCISLG
jgi:hypothetical protein